MLALRPYQKSIMDSIYESMKSGHRRPLVCAPCGSGKTVIFTDLAERTLVKGKTVTGLAVVGNWPKFTCHRHFAGIWSNSSGRT